MELSWTTFVLELVNFLVLLWLLKRLFYAPVMRAIDARRTAVERVLLDAEAAKREAASLETTYRDRLREWDEGGQRRHEELRSEMGEERERQMKLLESSMAAEREKAEARDEKTKAEHRAREERQAILQALEFTSRLLKDFASPELEGRILNLVVGHLSSPSTESLRDAFALFGNHQASIQVRSAYPLMEPQRAALSAALQSWLGEDISPTYETDVTLLAGLEIHVGSYVLRANLRDEMEFFADTRNHD